jgi:prolipoprotein diacylglyceryltransferase
MQQTLFTIPGELFGLPVFGIGLLLAIWILFSAILMFVIVRRQGFSAEACGFVPIIVLVVAVIVFLMPSLVEGGGLPIRGYGVMFLLGVVAGVGLAAYRAPKLNLDADVIVSLAFWMIAAGLAGARLFHVIEYWDISYRQTRLLPDGTSVFDLKSTLLEIVNIPKGGLVVYGSFFGGFAAFAWFVRKHKLPIFAVADLIAPSGMLGLTLGRIGCLLNGCCFGGHCDLPWAIEFPQTSSASGFTPPYDRQLEHGLAFGLYIKVEADDTLVVDRVDPNGSAAEQGIKTGDVIMSIDGTPLTPVLRKDGRKISVLAQLRERFRLKTALYLETSEDARVVYLRWSPRIADLETKDPVARVESGFGLTFAREGNAIVIKSVDPDSPAHARGLESAMRINKLDEEDIITLAQAKSRFVRKANVRIVTADNPAPKTLTFAPPPHTPGLQPTQIYSAINAIVLLCLFLAYYPFRRRDGEVFALWVSIYPVTRFLLEVIRTDEAAMFGTGLSISQIVSVILLVSVVVIWILVLRQPKGELWANTKR